MKIPLSDQAENSSQWPLTKSKMHIKAQVENSFQWPTQNSSHWPVTKSKISFQWPIRKFLLETKLKIPLRHHHKGFIPLNFSSAFKMGFD